MMKMKTELQESSNTPLVMSGLGPEARSPPEPGPKSPGPARPECWAYMGLGPGLLK